MCKRIMGLAVSRGDGFRICTSALLVPVHGQCPEFTPNLDIHPLGGVPLRVTASGEGGGRIVSQIGDPRVFTCHSSRRGRKCREAAAVSACPFSVLCVSIENSVAGT